MRNQVLLLLTAAALIVAAGFVEGRWSNRWGMSPELSSLSERLGEIPPTLGGWTSSDGRLSDREVALAGATGHLVRTYSRRADGARITILLLAGLPRDIAAHTPDVCYPGAGYQLDQPERIELTSESTLTAVLRTARARSPAPGATPLRIYWSWNDGEGWQAPDDPRWTFAGRRALCKLYAVADLSTDNADATETPTAELLRVLLPETKRALLGSSPNRTSRQHPEEVRQ
jgi:hypothetical protein